MNDWSISILNGIMFCVKEKTPNTNNTSWNTATTAPKLNCHLLKRTKIYKNTTNKDPNTAQKEFFLISSAIVGLTL